MTLDAEFVVLTLLTSMAGAALILALAFPYPANLLPLIVGIPTTGIGILALASFLRRRTPERDAAAKEQRIHPLVLMGWLALAVVLMWGIGIIRTVPVYVFLYTVILGRMAWLRALALSLATGVIVYVLFVLVLNVQLNAGWIWRVV